MNLGTTGSLISKSISNTTFQGGALVDDISTAVYILQPQSKTVFTKPNGFFAVSFIDNTNTLHIANIED